MKELESKCYDKFDFRLEQLQVLIARAGKFIFNADLNVCVVWYQGRFDFCNLTI